MKILFLVIGALLSNILFAEQVDTILVKKIAVNTMQNLSPMRGVYKIDYLKTYKVNNIPTFYLVKFNKTGFVIVSANDATIPILAYSISSNTGIENVSPSYQDFIDYFNESIDYANKNNLPNIKTKEKWNNILNKNNLNNRSITAVSPLLIETKWAQSISIDLECEAYNYYVPEVDIDCICSDVNSTSTKAPTGCVATAMGQIMKFWQDTDNNFDWCNMVNELFYDNNQNTNYVSERNAVAELIADCGDKAEMEYCSNDCSSSSTIWKARQAFRNDYDYSNDMDRRYRWLTPWWKTKMRKSLDGDKPILYGGNTDDGGGHAFVCDGYDGDDYFQFGW